MWKLFTVFRCRGCDAPLSASLRRAEWQPVQHIPGREHYTYGPSTVLRGSFMFDPAPFGTSYEGSDCGECLTVVINPLDGVLLRPHVDPVQVGCCRPDGSAGPNLMCSRCGAEVGFEVSDCWTEFDVRLLLPKVVQDTSDSCERRP